MSAVVKGHYGAWASLALLMAPYTQADEQLLGAGYLKSYESPLGGHLSQA